MKYRDTASFGRRQEYSVIAELLKRNFDVYMTLVDDQGIDCVIRLDDKRYVDVQIKARSKGVDIGTILLQCLLGSETISISSSVLRRTTVFG